MDGGPGERGGMMEFLVLRFDAPLMSFGTVAVDQIRETADYPALSMVAGLLGNALGYDHSEWNKLQRLQERIRFAVRQDRAGERLVDYQTVDLGQDFLLSGWTTFGREQKRGGGGSSARGTHIRLRHYLADAVYTVVLTLDPPDDKPALGDVEQALRRPARPLFIGRKCCIPSRPILAGKGSAKDLLEALGKAPFPKASRDSRFRWRARSGQPVECRAWWPETGLVGSRTMEELEQLGQRRLFVTDTRDWANQIHVGRRPLVEGSVRLSRKEERA